MWSVEDGRQDEIMTKKRVVRLPPVDPKGVVTFKRGLDPVLIICIVATFVLCILAVMGKM